MITRRTALTGAALSAGAIALVACSDDDTTADPTTGTETTAGETTGTETTAASGELTPVRLQLQWFAQAQFAGYYAALDQGFYEEEGLAVEILEGGADIVPQDVLSSGQAEFALAWVPKVLGSIEQGASLTNVAQIFERSATLQVARADSGITSPADFAGKRIGSWGYGNEWELFAGMQQAGVTLEDITLVTQAFDMNGFLQGDIDAAQAMTYNEYAQILEAINPDTGELWQPEELSVIDWNEVGTAMLQDAIWADASKLESDEAYQATTVAFIKGSIRGWIYAAENPEETATIVTNAGSTLGTSHQLWMTNETNKLIFPSTNGVGLADQAAWDSTVEISMNTQNETGSTLITTTPPETAFTTTYVEQAIAELTEEGVDVMLADYAPIEVTLNEGGN